jgi:lipopolysaccharide export system protein LptC
MNIDDVQLSVLATISKGYTAGQILDTIEQVINNKNQMQYSMNMCTANDFLPILGMKTPIFIDEENKIKVDQCVVVAASNSSIHCTVSMS